MADARSHQGLYLVANENGFKAWIIQIPEWNKLREIKLGEYPAMELGNGRKPYLEQRALRNLNIDPWRNLEEHRKARRGRGTFNQIPDFAYIESILGRAYR